MHDTLRRLHEGRRGTGTTLDRFRLNELVSQIAFGGRRGRVYRRIVSLAGVRTRVLDPGRGVQQRVPRQEAGRRRRVGWSRHRSGPTGGCHHARRPAPGAITFTVGVVQDLPLLDSSFGVVTCRDCTFN